MNTKNFETINSQFRTLADPEIIKSYKNENVSNFGPKFLKNLKTN